jgi:hypothetical protein
MAEERTDSREMTWRTLFPWTELFRGFQLALDPNKLLLAAIGIFAMAIVWWFLAWFFSSVFFSNIPPDWKQDFYLKPENANATSEKKAELWATFTHKRRQWNLMHRATGLGNGASVQVYQIEDLVGTLHDYETLLERHDAFLANLNKKLEDRDPKLAMPAAPLHSAVEEYVWIIEHWDLKLDEPKEQLLAVIQAKLGKPKPSGELSTLPWSENRGPNPFLLVTGQAGRPWEAGHFWDWFISDQVPVVIEPVEKLVLPLVFFFNADAEGSLSVYFFLVFAATVAIWSLVGGAITRIAAVQIARGEKIDFMEAVRFTLKRWASYLMAPVYPLAFIILLLIFGIIFGLLHMIPLFGDIFISGIFWPIPLLLGFVIALAVVGLVVGWPLMPPTISTEGTDSWEALSRSFSYVFQKPFHYLWYALVAICYGAVLIFFVGFMGSFTVYLSKWAVSQTPTIKWTKRDPVYLFVYAPESFGWRELLLKDQLVDGDPLVINGHINEDAYERYLGLNGKKTSNTYDQLTGWNKFAAGMVAFWLYLVFLVIIGFGYALFWSLMTVIYFLLRRNVDAAELDEVYLEEDEHDLAYSGPLTPPPAPPPPPPATKSEPPQTMMESPTLRTPPAPPSTPTPPPTAAPTPSGSVPRIPAPEVSAGEKPVTEPVKPATADGNPTEGK